MLFKGKKAQATPEETELGKKTIFYVIVGFMILIMAFVLIFVIGKFRTISIETPPELATTLHVQRFLGCFAYQDPFTGRIYPGIIDSSKFTEELLNKCYLPKDKVQQFGLELKAEGVQERILTENYQGSNKNTPIYVLVYDKGKLKPGQLFVGVQY